MKDEMISGTEKLNISAGLFEKEEAYWVNKFHGEAAGSCFPYDYGDRSGPRSKEKVFQDFTGELYRKLIEISNENDQLLHMIFTAGLAVLLRKYSCEAVGKITIGVPIYKQESEGNFVNTALPVKCRIGGDTTFKELLLQVREVFSQAVEHQNYPLEKLFYKLGLSFSEDHFPLFDTVILSGNIHERKYISHTKPGMIFSFARTGEHIAGELEYNTALYKKSSAVGIFWHFRDLLMKCVSDLDILLSGIDILSQKEKKRLLYDFNDTAKHYPRHLTMSGLFAEQVAKTPGHIALVSERKYATYGYVNERSDKLAVLLKKRGINANTIVGVMAEPSIGMTDGIIGILKAGGAYLPIDIEMPAERIVSILQDSGVSTLLTGSSITLSGFTDVPEVEVVKIDEQLVSGLAADNLKHAVSPDDLAYVIYTSGSTGRPKGVLVDHKSAANTLCDRKREYAMDARSVALQLFSYAFDGFVTGFFTPVISGASVVLLNRREISDIARIRETIVRNRVTHFISVPALFKVIIENIKPAETASIRVVTLAGDMVPFNLIEQTLAKNPDIEVAIEYGVTEAGVMSTVYRRREKDEEKIVKIGKPIANTQLYIVDKENILLPEGAPGELCIAGTGLGRGYLNQPALTAEKFIKFAARQDFVYLSGDLARWLPDGNVEFLGRIDRQVKLRGLRIEPGEIENQLLKAEYIREAIVIAVSTNPAGQNSDKYLCAYVTASKEIEKEELIKYLSEKLPSYMIPSHIVQLEELPLSVNGKVDRKALEELKISVGQRRYITPGTETEKKLAAIWTEILDMDENAIGTKSNFFELGGHSLKAISLMTRIHKTFNVKLRLADIFNTQTIERTAEYIDSRSRDKFVSINPVERKEYYPLSSAQKRMYIIQQMDLISVAYNQPQVLPLNFVIHQDKLTMALNKLLSRHESFRTSFEMKHDEPVQIIRKEMEFKIDYLEFKDTDNAPPPVESLVRDFVRPFDLSKAPILRVKLVKLEENKNILLIDMHHIICDGVSIELIINDFMRLYGGDKLPRLRLQYKDYAVWQNSAAHKLEIKKQEAYWLSEFAGEVFELELPLDYKRPQAQDFSGGIVYFKVENSLEKRLAQMKEKTGVTLSTLLLAHFYILLSKYSGQEDIVVGIPTVGRSHVDLENIAGMFVNVLSLRNFTGRDVIFSEFLRQVNTSSLNAYDNQDYQFDELVDRLGLSRSHDRNPLFNSVFSFQKSDREEERKSGNETKHNAHEPVETLSKFDLKLGVIEIKHSITMYLEYKTALFKKETIENIASAYLKIIEQTLADPRIKLADIVIPTGVLPVDSENQDDQVDFDLS
jgi:amino acid adenylation domain-containing protein